MSNQDWTSNKLGDYFQITHGFAFKSKFFAQGGDFILLTPGNFNADGGIKLKGDKEKYYTGDFPDEYLLRRGDLLVVMTDLTQNAPILGSPAIIPQDGVFLHNQRLGKIVNLDVSRMSQRFLYYLFNFHSVRAQIKASATGATVRHTAPSRICDVEVDVPPLPTQRKIAAVLSAYDALVENNTRRIAVLEEMARLLYQEWFVRFRFPDHEDVALVDSELGPVPEGWEVVTVGDLFHTSSGGTPSRKVDDYFGGEIRWVKTRELDDRFIFDTEERITEAGLQKSSAKLFPAYTVIIAMYGATIGKLGILASPAATNQACCALLQKLVYFKHSYAFLYLLENRDDLINLRMGAAQQNISQQVIKGFPMLKPVESVMQRFNSLADPILDNIKVLQRQTITLRHTRDLLLPRLVSGQVDVSALEIDVGGLAA